jgi:DHA1 family tetracycline resistance protein-like MFS transporter
LFVLPESLPPSAPAVRAARGESDQRAARPRRAEGVGPLVAVVALASLAQFTLHTSWVLYTTFKFGWTPDVVGWSLFTVGMMSFLVQGVLLKYLLKLATPQRLAVVGLVGSACTYLGFGLASEGWMMFAVIIVGNLAGGGAQASIQSLISNAADPQSQGTTMGSVAALNSLMAVIAPALAAPLLGVVSHRPPGDPWIGLPFLLLRAAAGRFDRARAAPFQARAATPPRSACHRRRRLAGLNDNGQPCTTRS